VSELLVETPSQYGIGMLVRVLWLISNSNREVEKIRRNGVAESMQELDHQRSFVRDSKDRDRPPLN
jgi:U3 small nucleolar ribonucleoprotein component